MLSSPSVCLFLYLARLLEFDITTKRNNIHPLLVLCFFFFVYLDNIFILHLNKKQVSMLEMTKSFILLDVAKK